MYIEFSHPFLSHRNDSLFPMMKRVATTHQVYRHDKLVKLVAVSLAVVVALGLAEVLSRWLFPVPGRMKFVPDPMVGFRHAPNQKVWITNAAHEFGDETRCTYIFQQLVFPRSGAGRSIHGRVASADVFSAFRGYRR